MVHWTSCSVHWLLPWVVLLTSVLLNMRVKHPWGVFTATENIVHGGKCPSIFILVFLTSQIVIV